MRWLISGLMALVVCVALNTPTFATVPSVVSYQGQILDSLGTPVADGKYKFSFSIYDAPVGGFQYWTETQDSVAVKDGFFSTFLGLLTPLTDSVFGGANRYLQVALDGVDQTPRAQLTSVAYSLRVGTLDGSTGGTVFGSMTIEPAPDNTSTDRPSVVVLGGQDGGGIGIYEPVDNRANGTHTIIKKKAQLTSKGLILFGDGDSDTTLIFEDGGDITGIGKITMGQNSSSGNSTTVLGFNNNASGDSATVGGGSQNTASGTSSVVAGGFNNTASGTGSTIGGGANNHNSGLYGVIGGGFNNEVSGDYGTVPGGENNLGGGIHSFAAGFRARALHGGTFVWADATDADFSSTGDNQFLIRAGGGVGINTDSPKGVLDVVGPEGDGSVNLPASSISSLESSDEPGIATKHTVGSFQLDQKGVTMETMVQVTITTPGPGYIIVRGGAYLRSIYATKRNQAYLQISEAPASGLIPGAFTIAGPGETPSPNGEEFNSMSIEAVYVKEAGSYTFYLGAMAHPDNGANARTYINDPYLTALFVATSYGGPAEE